MDNKIAQRFWDKLQIGDGCWEWQAAKKGWGYGNFFVAGKSERAHRVAWQLWHGEDPGERQVLHKCDNPLCCRPDHLELGDQKQNMQQMVERNRCNTSRGVEHPKAKLTQEDVLAIRSSKSSQYALAREYGVSQAKISQVINRKCWTHI